MNTLPLLALLPFLAAANPLQGDWRCQAERMGGGSGTQVLLLQRIDPQGRYTLDWTQRWFTQGRQNDPYLIVGQRSRGVLERHGPAFGYLQTQVTEKVQTDTYQLWPDTPSRRFADNQPGPRFRLTPQADAPLAFLEPASGLHFACQCL